MSVTIKIGCIAKDTWENLKLISAYAYAGNYTSLQLPAGTPYQVPAGKVLKCGLVKIFNDPGGAKISFGYGDSFVDNSSAPPTNFVQLIYGLGMEVAYKIYNESIYFVIPAQKYPCIRSLSGTSTGYLFGFEED